MTTLQEFYDTVDDAIGEGGAQDSRIIFVSRMALRHLERQYNFRYMREELVVTMAAAAAGAGTIDLGNGVKTLISGEIRPEGGSLISGVSPLVFTDDPHVKLDEKKFEGKFPVYIRGQKTAVPLLATSVPQDFSFLLLRFTQDWADDPDTYVHPLFNELEDLFLAEVCLKLLPVSRDEDLQMFAAQRNESIQSLFKEGFILSTDDWQ